MMGFCLPPRTLDVAAELKLLCWMHAGINRLDADRLLEQGVRVCNSRGANGVAVAEHAMALLLGSAKRLVLKHEAMQRAEYFPLYEEGTRAAMLAGAPCSSSGWATSAAGSRGSRARSTCA
ncbi:MAG: hypothetical protein U5K43_13580 [Halofilum sp. (in: g-proteobacteria)]|nr:hypothetical protein [Halofilum sp. (in: g-proteobacteria)]